MRKLQRKYVSVAAVRNMTEETLGAAPRRERRQRSSVVAPTPPTIAPQVDAEFSTASLDRQLASLTPQQLDELQKKLEEREEATQRVLMEDSVYQLDVSMAARRKEPLKVFWKSVSVVSYEPQSLVGWYAVAVDGRRVKAFEATTTLAIPSEAYATACAAEWAAQEGHLNTLLMPLTDLASGAMRVDASNVAMRIHHLMSFVRTDNAYFRSPSIAEEQDRLVKPAVEWFAERVGVRIPRVVGLGRPHLSDDDVLKVRRFLEGEKFNPFQIVALCVAAQMTASLVVPLATFARAMDVGGALAFSTAEERRAIDVGGAVGGFHDIRAVDAAVKVSAAAVAWQLTKDLSMERCTEARRYSNEV